jgi:hypothetical protein
MSDLDSSHKSKGLKEAPSTSSSSSSSSSSTSSSSNYSSSSSSTTSKSTSPEYTPNEFAALMAQYKSSNVTRIESFLRYVEKHHKADFDAGTHLAANEFDWKEALRYKFENTDISMFEFMMYIYTTCLAPDNYVHLIDELSPETMMSLLV